MKGRFWHVWTMPIILAVLSLIGLVAALVGDGFMDFLSWLTLGVPLAVIGWFIYRPQGAGRKR